MFDGTLATLILVALIVVMVRQGRRMKRLEGEVEALRAAFQASGAAPAFGVAVADERQPVSVADEPAESLPQREPEPIDEPFSGPWAQPQPAQDDIAAEPVAVPTPRPDIETALGTRWAVWVGGIALAFGGIFLVRYSIEAGLFGPAARIAMAVLLGLTLGAGGELARRRGFSSPVGGAAGAYIPSILTAAGSFTLFAAIYAAYGIYGFIGPASAFAMLGVVGLGTVALALLHGQALAGIGLLGAMATPMLVGSDTPNAWALFGYLAVVLAATGWVARIRSWRFLMGAACMGVGIWLILYLGLSYEVLVWPVVFISLVMLAVVALAWLRAPLRFDGVTVIPAIILSFTAMALMLDPPFLAQGGRLGGTILILAMLAASLFRPSGLALLVGAMLAALNVSISMIPPALFETEWLDMAMVADAPVELSHRLHAWALVIGFLAGGLAGAARLVAEAPRFAAVHAAAASAVPVAAVLGMWLAFGNPDSDPSHAALFFAIAAVLASGAGFIARQDDDACRSLPVTVALIGAALALVAGLHAAFGPAWTTILVGAAAVLPALASRLYPWPGMGAASVLFALATLARIAVDPSIVGVEELGSRIGFNWLLPVYFIPAAAFGFAAWCFRRTVDGPWRLAMEAACALFVLLGSAMLVRHAMNGGLVATTMPSLAEQAIYTLIALGGGAILLALDRRSPSPVFRYGSMAIGVMSAIFIVMQHFGALNPVWTGESTGRLPVLDLNLLAYLIPALASAGLALMARHRRPAWYVGMLAILSAALAFAWATLSVRRLFHGEFIPSWKGLLPLETYTYSAMWLAIGVVLLAIGVRRGSRTLRVASAVLVSAAVAKVFLFDMSELEGVLRALSFIGLGAVLIGIGMFYQRLLRARPAA